MSEKVLIVNGKLFDGVDGKTKDNKAIVIENGIISVVGDAPANADEYEVIDASGKFVMPGIIDCHMHIGGIISDDIIQRIVEPNMQQAMVAVGQAEKTIQHGITTACDVSMAGIYLKRLIDMGELTGPRILASGQGFAMGGGGPYCDPEGLFPNDFIRENHPWGDPCDGADNLRHGVRMRLKVGCNAIKIWATGGGAQERIHDTDRIYTDEEITAVVDEANLAGIPVIAHCESVEGAKAAIRCGVRGILHGLVIDQDCIDLFKEKGAWFLPTLKTNLDWDCSDEELSHQPGLENYPGDTLQEKEKARIVANFRNAYDQGVKIALASDTYCNEDTPYGEFTLGEIKTMVNQGGISAEEALMASTRYAAEVLDIDYLVGTLEAGKHADILILDEDITKNIDLLEKENINTVLKDGKRVV